MKRFWKKTEGFTLVELIVVIAILGILAGVGTVGYSGYVKKANMAADQALLGIINNAFAAACVDNNANIHSLTNNPKLNLTAEKAVDSVSVYNDAFEKYYAGNEDSKFKTDNTIIFDNLRGFILFVDGETVNLRYGNGYVTISAEDAQKLADSTFIDKLDVDGLLNKVDFVADFAAGVNSDTYDGILGSTEYMKSFLENLGMKNVSTMADPVIRATYNRELPKMVDEMLNKWAEENGWTDTEKEAHRSDAEKKMTANMAVLYAAQSTSNLSDAQINSLLNTDTPKTTILASATSGGNLAQAALYYGMYVGYAHYKGDDSLISAIDNPKELLTSPDLDTAGFKAYVNSDVGKADLAAYMASMNMITDSATNADAVNNIVVNGFGDAELIALIQQAIGK